MVIMAWGIHLFPYRTQKLSLITLMVLGGQPPGRVRNRQIIFSPSGSWRTLHGMVELSERLSLLTKSFLVQKIYTCHEKSSSTKAYPRSRATFRGKWWCPTSWTQIKAYLPIPNTENKPVRLIEYPPWNGRRNRKPKRQWYSKLAVRLLL